MLVYVCPDAPDKPTFVVTVPTCPFCLRSLGEHDCYINKIRSVGLTFEKTIVNKAPEGLTSFTDYLIKVGNEVEQFIHNMTDGEREEFYRMIGIDASTESESL